MKSKRTVLAILGLLTIAALAFPLACTSAQPQGSASKEPVKIGMPGALTGWHAERAIYTQNGVRAAVKEINDKGGILGGRPIELIERDTQSTVDGAISAVERLITQDGVKGIVGTVDLASAPAVMEIVRKYNVPFIDSVPADFLRGARPYNGLVLTNQTSVHWIVVTGLTVMKFPNVKTVSILSMNTDVHKGGVDLMKKLLAGQPSFPKIVGEVYFPTDAKDLTGPVTKVLEPRPDAVLVIEYREQVLNSIWRFMQAKDYKGVKIVQGGSLFPRQLKDIPDAIQGVYSPSVWAPDIDTQDNKNFISLYKQMWGEEPVFFSSPMGYESVKVMAAAMEKAGTDSESAKVSAALRSVKVSNLIGGTLRFADIGGLLVDKFVIQQAKGDKIVHAAELDGEVPQSVHDAIYVRK